ncbi:hypothetical protein AB0H58_32445 [Nocardia neocaledoniensis]|uniref:hypothetical protein n=1 Tax=Nocardia neocaledoniensis TaxID=236511 RepID=UPI0033F6FF22
MSPLTEHFALAARNELVDGGIAIPADRLTLAHIPTGRAICWSAWLSLHDLAPRLEALPINWSSQAVLTADQIEMVRTVVQEAEHAHHELSMGSAA